MKLYLGCMTDRGNYREKNQDRIMCARKQVGEELLAVSCVCDGIGSFEQSEIASGMMVEGITKWFDGVVQYYPNVLDRDGLVEDLEITIRELNELIHEYRQNHQIAIGCTMSLMFWVNNEYFVYHVGDSRIYRVRDMLFQMTQDEVLLRQQDGREKTLLVNYIGKSSELCLNRQRGMADHGDMFVLGTDGLCSELIYEDVSDLPRHINSDDAVVMTCKYLIDLVLSRGVTDNVSCAIVQVKE